MSDIEKKSDRELLIELHTHILGRGGMLDRIEQLEKSVDDLRDFKTKWATVAAVIVGVGTLVVNWLIKVLS